MNTTLLLLAAYSALLVVVGLWIARAVKGASDFFVAGRQLTAPLLFSTVLAANIGAGTTIGAAGKAYQDGISAWWWNGSAAIGSLFLAFLIGPRVWAIAKEHNLYTTGDFLEWRYGGEVRGLTTALIWVGTLFILAAQLIAGAAILDVVAGIPRWAGVLVGGVAMTTYFVAGGLLSSAWVNMVQLAVLLGGFVVATPLIVSSVGGLDAIREVTLQMPEFGDVMYSAGPGSGWALFFLLAPNFIISPGLMQKAYGAADARTVRRGIGAQAVAIGLFSFLPVTIGMATRAAHPDLAIPDQALPLAFAEHLHPLFGALALAAVFSAEVSTCDAILFMLATSLSKDLYKRFVNPLATDRQLLTVARVAAIVGGAAGVTLAIQLPPSVLTALGVFYSLVAVALFVPVAAGLLVRRAGTREALAAIAAGCTARVALQIFNDGRGIGVFDPTLLGMMAAAAAFFGTLAARRAAQDK